MRAPAFEIHAYVPLKCIYSASNVAAQLVKVLHFIKNISSQPLSGLDTCLFINEPLLPLIPSRVEMSRDELKSQTPPDFSGLHADQLFQPLRHQKVGK